MRWLRYLSAAVIAGYGALMGLGLANVVVYKLGLISRLTPRWVRAGKIWDATPWWQVGLWFVMVVLMLTAAVRLVRRERAFEVYLAAFAAAAGLWWLVRSTAPYQAVLTRAEWRSDFYTLAIMLLAGAGVWFVERTPPAPRVSGPAF